MTEPFESPQLLGEMLIAAGCIDEDELDKALRFQAEYGGWLGTVLNRMGVCSEDRLLPVLAEQLGVYYAPNAQPPSAEAVAAGIQHTGFYGDWFLFRQIIPWLDDDGQLHFAGRDPANVLINELVEARGLDVAWHLLGSQAESLWLGLVDARSGGNGDDEAYLREMAEEAPVVSLVNNVLTQAVELDASDIHLEPDNGALRVRFRIDGVLVDHMRTTGTRMEAVLSRVKLMADLDIAERRLPQDGRISLQAAGMTLDVRISTLPDTDGESVVMRLLPKDDRRLDLDVLGLEPDLYQQMKHVANQPHGLMLVTGPTGSGKSTTLYALLGEVNNGERKIITVEDPVENRMDGVVQVQAHADIGYDFARALRAILRQDPDVIMIGEVRDGETAGIAVQSSLTGHTVFSTLHTNDAISAFGRLIDMGVEPYLLASAVRGVLAQRLVRRVCPYCREPEAAPDGLSSVLTDLRARFGALLPDTPDFHRAVGCRQCLGTGYSGRVGIYEWIEVGPVLERMVSDSEPRARLSEALPSHFRTLREDGLLKAWRGQTTLDEVFRVTGVMEGMEEDEPPAPSALATDHAG